MDIDYLIIGQGISGTLLSRSLLNEGKSVIVIDNGNKASSSRVASGVINPVTGKRLVRTWMIDEFLPYSLGTYQAMEQEIGCKFVSQCSILDFYQTLDNRAAFLEKSENGRDGYLHQVRNDEQWSEYFRFSYGIGEIAPCLLVEIGTLVAEWRKHLLAGKAMIEEQFHFDNCSIEPDKVTYRDIVAEKIIFCNGAVCADNPYFDILPWSKDKGEALIVSIQGLPAGNIYRQGIHIVPWQDGLFWVGATHDWKFADMQPTPAFRKQTKQQLDYWLKLPYTIVDHLVAARPVNMDRKPFVGLHPGMPSVGIFNGMGTKGCSVGPYFADQFARHLVHGSELLPEVDVRRFAKILSK